MNMICDSKAFKYLVDLDRPTLKGLIVVLRNKELWPEGFSWNYTYCLTCAMGLAHQLWSGCLPRPSAQNCPIIGDRFGLNETQSKIAFLGGFFTPEPWVPNYKNDPHALSKVTPEMIADILETYL